MGHWVKPPVCGREKRGTPGSRRVRPEAKQAGAGRCRQIRKATALKLTAAAFFLLIVLLLVGLTLGPEPVPGEEKAKYAAAYAAGKWGVRWTSLAADCKVTRLGKARSCHCRRCGGPIYPGAPQNGALFAATKEGLCLECQRKEQLHRREMAGIRGADRRPGARR